MAGVDEDTPLGTALDVISVLIIDVPTDQIKQWRKQLDDALVQVNPVSARDTWGLEADHQAAMGWMLDRIPPAVGG